MDVRFYNFSKRSIETKKPTGEGTKITCHLKEATSISAPILLLSSIENFNFNYAYIPKWSRYYFVNPPVSVEDMWEVSLTEDLLASFKSEIGNTKCNILYATGATGDIVDTRIPIQAGVDINNSEGSITGWDISQLANQNAILLGITGNGSLGTYLMENPTEVHELLDWVDDWSTFITDNWTFTKQFFCGGSAAENLKSAIALPLKTSVLTSYGTRQTLNLGAYPCCHSDGTPIYGYRINRPLANFDGSINIPWINSDWRRAATYCELYIYVPLCGMIKLPVADLKDETSLDVRISINITSGDISAWILAHSSGKVVATASGNCAMNTAYGSTGLNTAKGIAALASGAGVVGTLLTAAATGGLSAAGELAMFAGLGSAALNTIGALGGSSEGSGGMGGGSSHGYLYDKLRMWCVSKKLTDTQANFDPIIGKPCMKVAKPSNYSGYIQTSGFQLASNNIYASERDAINSLLDSGIYYT